MTASTMQQYLSHDDDNVCTFGKWLSKLTLCKVGEKIMQFSGLG